MLLNLHFNFFTNQEWASHFAMKVECYRHKWISSVVVSAIHALHACDQTWIVHVSASVAGNYLMVVKDIYVYWTGKRTWHSNARREFQYKEHIWCGRHFVQAKAWGRHCLLASTSCTCVVRHTVYILVQCLAMHRHTCTCSTNFPVQYLCSWNCTTLFMTLVLLLSINVNLCTGTPLWFLYQCHRAKFM